MGLPLLLGTANAAQAYEHITITAPPDARERHSGTTDHTFKVRLSGPVSGDVNYKVCFSGTATRTVDYDPTLGGTVESANCVNGRIPGGSTTPDSAIGIRVTGDTVSESGRWRGEYGETVTAHLTLVGAQPWDLVGRRAHTVTHTILNDDVAVSFRKATYEGREGKRVRIQVDLVEQTQGYPWDVTVPLRYTTQTAIASDYDASRTSLTFRRGQTTRDLYVDLTDDSNFEGTEAFDINLDTAGFPDGMYVSGITRTRVNITDNDYSIETNRASYGAREDAGGVSISVTISPAQERTVGVRVDISPQLEAVVGQDILNEHHSFPDGVLIFRPGETTKSIFIPVIDDGVDQINGFFQFTLTQTVGSTDPLTRDVIIIDFRPGDGYTSKLTLARTSRETDYEGQSATFRLKMHPAVQRDSTAAVLLSQSADDGGRANWIAGAPDKNAHYVTVDFALGESEKTLTVPIRSDGRDTNGTLTVAAMGPGDHPGSAGTFTARGQKVTAKVRILDTTADGDPHRSAPLQDAVTEVPFTAVSDMQDSVGTVACDTASLKSDMNRYIGETQYGNAHVARWERALAGLNEEAGGMTAAGARQMMATYSPGRWQPVVDALDCLEAAAAQPETPAAVPEITVSGGNGITEGGTASFTVTATPAPSTPLAVTLTVGQSGDHAASGETGTRQVTVPTGGSVAIEVATENDGTDEPDGSVSATVEPGTGYTVGSANTATVSVADDDDPVPDPVIPELRLSAGTPVDEGGNAVFTVHADAAPEADLTVAFTVSQTGDVLSAPGAGSRQLTLAAGTTSATLTLATADDGVDEPDGSVSVTLDAGAGYTLAAGQAVGTVAVRDNDEPVVSIAAGSGVTEGAPAAFTLTANPVPHAALTVSLAVTQSGDFAASGQTGTREVTIPTGGSIAFEVATVNDTADEPDGSVTATLAAGSGYAVAASPDDAASVAVADDDVAAVPEGPSLSVNDVEVKEGPYRRVTFTVTLSEALEKYVSFYYRVRESSPVSAKRGVDFWASTHKNFAGIRPGQTEYRIRAAMVIDDSHDEDPETFEIVLSDANGAAIADAVGVATIVNDDPMPAAWLARFGRTVAEQALDGIAGRIAAPREAGARGTIAGQSLSFGTSPWAGPGTGSGADGATSGFGARSFGSLSGAANDNAGLGGIGLSGSGFGSQSGTGLLLALSEFGTPVEEFGGGHGLDDAYGPGESRTVTGLEVLLGSSFTATGEQDGSGGSLAFWGRAAQSSFDGREGTFSLDGETTTAMLGADYARGNWLAGLALMQSSGEGGYNDSGIGAEPCPEDMDGSLCNGAVRTGDGDVEASLTAAVPYAAIQASESLKLWGAAGYGTGEVTLKPAVGGSLSSDISWTMAAAGARSDLVTLSKEGSGLALALTSDALWARTSSEKTHELAASDSDVTRLRVGLEGSYAIATEGDGHLTPRVEIGARHDGGDAETGFGMELGGGIAWVDPAMGLSLDLSGRTLIAHGDDDLEDRGFAASMVFDPDPGTERGLSLTLTQDWGGAAQGGLDALFATDPLADRAGFGEATSRWQAEAAYGLPAFGGTFTGSPHVGLGLATGSRDYTLGWRLSPAANANAPDVSFGVKATRHESEGAEPVHTTGLEGVLRW